MSCTLTTPSPVRLPSGGMSAGQYAPHDPQLLITINRSGTEMFPSPNGAGAISTRQKTPTAATCTPYVTFAYAIVPAIEFRFVPEKTLTCAAPGPVPVTMSEVPSQLTSADATRTPPWKSIGYGKKSWRTA